MPSLQSPTPPSSRSLPPGPPHPAAWQLVRYSLAPFEFLEQCSRRYGDVFTIRLAGFGPLVVLSDLDSVKDVLRGDPDALHSGEGNEFLSVIVGKSSVLVLDGERHTAQRRLLLPAMKGERMRAFSSAMEAAARDVADAWPIGRPVRMDASMRQITLRVILEVVFGPITADERTLLENKFERMLAHARNRFALILLTLSPHALLENSRWMPYYREVRDLDAHLFTRIAAERAKPAGSRCAGILGDLLAATHEDGRAMSDAEIRDAVVTLVVAGYETTSIALAWSLVEIVPRTAVVERLRDELACIASESERRVSAIDELPYLDAVVRECLRARTILPIAVRLTKTPFRAGDREYPAGIKLCPSNHLVHHREDLYPDPQRFRPERFLERKYAAHEWFPFGGGNRTCLGMAFALHEMKLVLATIFSRIELARPSGARSRPLRQGLALAPHDGARMVVANRRARD